MKISFIIPSRNNLKYLKWSYKSIRKNQGDHEVQICVADDASEDGTWDWCNKMMKEDPNFDAILNMGPGRLGLVILNDKLVNEVVISDICMIWHADMYLCPGALDAIEKHLKEKTIVSLTRIEPPLHPQGQEKVLLDCGIEPEEFDENKLLQYIEGRLGQFDKVPTTEGIFAPWAFWKKDFQEIGGHDKLFAPQSKEDSDIFNRFQLNGVKFVQTWEGFVYHMTCRGSRFNPYSGGAPGKDSEEWKHTTTKNMRNFIRKWGHMVQHDQYLNPIIPPKYDIGFIIHNCNKQMLHALEPWCSNIYLTMPTPSEAHQYIAKEQKNTKFDLIKRIRPIDEEKYNNILVEFDATKLNENNFNNILCKLPEIINSTNEVGKYKLDIFKVIVNSLETYEKKLINVKNRYKPYMEIA